MLERLAEIQRGVLVAAAAAVRPGGVLVYATCTISRRENEDQIAALLEASAAGEAPPLTLEDLGARAPELAATRDSRCLQVRPDRDRTSGFFIGRFKRDDGEG
jgi:16S rRNA (cytosine967-C5)-methyltransferase